MLPGGWQDADNACELWMSSHECRWAGKWRESYTKPSRGACRVNQDNQAGSKQSGRRQKGAPVAARGRAELPDPKKGIFPTGSSRAAQGETARVGRQERPYEEDNKARRRARDKALSTRDLPSSEDSDGFGTGEYVGKWTIFDGDRIKGRGSTMDITARVPPDALFPTVKDALAQTSRSSRRDGMGTL